MKVFCYGASGHGKVVADILRLAGAELIGFMDDDPAKAGTRLAGAQVLGTSARLSELAGIAAILTIGCNRIRIAKAAELQREGFAFTTAVHPSAIVAQDVSIGPGTVIMAGAVVNSGTKIGAHAIINTGATVDHDCVLGDGVHISPGASLAGGVVVGRSSQVGVRGSVIQGIQIGDDAIIGAGSVVIRDIPAGVTAVGSPARVLSPKDDLGAGKQQVFVGPEQSIRETMKAIDASGLAIALVVDRQRRLLGTVTDGDIRRALLRGIDIQSPTSSVMNQTPVTVSPAEDIAQIREFLLGSTLKHAVVTDSRNRVMDLITIADVLSVPQGEACSEFLPARRSGPPALTDFEQKLAAYAGRRYAVAVNSGTAALHVLCRALRFAETDEVITTPLVLFPTDDWLAREACSVRFADVDRRTYNLDAERIEAAITGYTKAIVAVDTLGQPADYDSIQEIATRHGLDLIVDARQSLGAEYKHGRAASHGRAAVFGFDSLAQITTGEGGAIVTDDEALAESCRALAYHHRLAELNCGFGLPQLNRVEEILESRQRLAGEYDRLLENTVAVIRPCISAATTRISWHSYPVRLSEDFAGEACEQIINRLCAEDLGFGFRFSAALTPTPQDSSSSALTSARAACTRLVVFPIRPQMKPCDTKRAVAKLMEAMARVSLKKHAVHAQP